MSDLAELASITAEITTADAEIETICEALVLLAEQLQADPERFTRPNMNFAERESLRQIPRTNAVNWDVIVAATKKKLGAENRRAALLERLPPEQRILVQRSNDD